MISTLRRLFVPDDSLSPADNTVRAFFEIIAFALGWNGVDRLLAGISPFIVVPIFAATILASYTGFKWPQIRPKVSPHFASTVERIASNRWYRRVLYFDGAIWL